MILRPSIHGHIVLSFFVVAHTEQSFEAPITHCNIWAAAAAALDIECVYTHVYSLYNRDFPTSKSCLCIDEFHTQLKKCKLCSTAKQEKRKGMKSGFVREYISKGQRASLFLYKGQNTRRERCLIYKRQAADCQRRHQSWKNTKYRLYYIGLIPLQLCVRRRRSLYI